MPITEKQLLAPVNKPKRPTVVVIAGPNGAGKSTAAPYLLKQALGILEFVNADQIAVGLSAYSPETVSFEAGRISSNACMNWPRPTQTLRLNPPSPAEPLPCS